jgi:hypothetical protein
VRRSDLSDEAGVIVADRNQDALKQILKRGRNGHRPDLCDRSPLAWKDAGTSKLECVIRGVYMTESDGLDQPAAEWGRANRPLLEL